MPANKLAAAKAGALEILVEILAAGGSVASQCAAAVALCALTEGKGALVAQAVAAGAAGPVVSVVQRGDADARGWAARAVYNVASAGDDDAVDALLAAGAAEALAGAVRHAADTGDRKSVV